MNLIYELGQQPQSWNWFPWLIGAVLVPVLVLVVHIWWRVESRHDEKIDQLRAESQTAIQSVNEKIDGLYDKIVDLWKSRSRKGDKR